MKPLFHTIKKAFTRAGARLNAVWQVVRGQAARLGQTVRRKAATAARVLQMRAQRFWQRHGPAVTWLAAWVVFGTLATAGLLYLYHTNPQARVWLDRLAGAGLATFLAPLEWLAGLQAGQPAVVPAAAQTVTPRPVPIPPRANSGAGS